MTDCREAANNLMDDVGWSEAKSFADLAAHMAGERKERYLADFWDLVSKVLDGEDPAYA